jgi:sarcosine oxidase
MDTRVIVIGLGCVGSATCAELARRGAKVIGLEQFKIGHTRGSSSHQSRGFRMAYAEHPGYVPLLRRAREHWMELNDRCDLPVFYETGGLYMSKQDAAFAPDSIAAAIKHDLPHEVLDADTIRERWPVFDITDEMIGIHEPLAGMIVPERAIAAHVEIAISLGANLRTGVKVYSWRETADGIAVETSDGVLHADHLVLCAGAWTGTIAEVPTLDIRPSRQVIAWFDAPATAHVEAPNMPLWALSLHDDSLLYGFPRMSGLPGPEGFKVARHWPGPTVDPDDEDAMRVKPGDESDVAPHLARWLPTANGPVRTVHTCLYSNSVDGHFRIGHHPDCDRVSILSALSGHGFKFQPVLGEIAADLALGGANPSPLEFLAIGRSS